MLAEPEKPQTDAVLGLPPATFVSLCNSLTEMYLKQVSSMQNGIGETATTAQRVMLAWCLLKQCLHSHLGVVIACFTVLQSH